MDLVTRSMVVPMAFITLRPIHYDVRNSPSVHCTFMPGALRVTLCLSLAPLVPVSPTLCIHAPSAVHRHRARQEGASSPALSISRSSEDEHGIEAAAAALPLQVDEVLLGVEAGAVVARHAVGHRAHRLLLDLHALRLALLRLGWTLLRR